MGRASSVIFLIAYLLGLFCSSASAAVVSTLGFEEFKYDSDALAEIGRLKTVDEMRKWMSGKHKVRSLEIPANKKDRRFYAPEAWQYFHLKQVEEAGGVFVPAYISIKVSDGDSKTPAVFLDYSQRPFGDQDLILLRPNSLRSVVMHEFFHFLIRQEQRGSSEAERRKWAKFEGEISFESILRIGSERFSEELAINLTLLAQRRALQLDVTSEQYLLATLQDDFDRYFKKADEGILYYASLNSTENNWLRAAEITRAKLAKSWSRYREIVDQMIQSDAGLNVLRKINAKGLRLIDPDLKSSKPRAILGIPAGVEIDREMLTLVFRFWALRFYPERGGDRASFQKIVEAKDRFFDAEEESRALTEEDAAITMRLSRFTTRLATMCAVGAAYCGFDTALPWNADFHNIDLKWDPMYFFMTIGVGLLSRNDPTPPTNPVREGIKSGVVRAAVLAGCWEALKLLAR